MSSSQTEQGAPPPSPPQVRLGGPPGNFPPRIAARACSRSLASSGIPFHPGLRGCTSKRHAAQSFLMVIISCLSGSGRRRQQLRSYLPLSGTGPALEPERMCLARGRGRPRETALSGSFFVVARSRFADAAGRGRATACIPRSTLPLSHERAYPPREHAP